MTSTIKNNEVEIRVCKHCDAPLPCYPEQISYYTKSEKICDDCFSISKKFGN